jgi:superfamily II DNA/RNA helicase
LEAVDRSGFERPTPVQQKVIPLALAGRDLLVRAATGSGKTAAFLLPLMQRLLDRKRTHAGSRALILAPTRELARQIRGHFRELVGETGLTARIITGGVPKARQAAGLDRQPDVLVATPGRLLEHLEHDKVALGDLEVLVLDEADRMLDMGFANEVLAIAERCAPRRQTLLFSATLEHRGLGSIAAGLLRDPLPIATNSYRTAHPDIRHQRVLADDPEHKRVLLLALLDGEEAEKVLVFTNTRVRADEIGAFLFARERRAATLHGELEPRERSRVLDLLRRGTIRVLVATDLAARGLDVPGTDLVINFDVPRNGGEYLHRSGRTGRAGEAGLAVSLVGPGEWNRMASIARYLDLPLEPRTLAGLEARFSGPRTKKGAKAAKPKIQAGEGKSAAKIKDRLRDRKNIGKRRKPTSAAAEPTAPSPWSAFRRRPPSP